MNEGQQRWSARQSGATPVVSRAIVFGLIHGGDNEDEPSPAAAIVTGVNDDGTIDIVFFATGQTFFLDGVQYAEKLTPGYWSWPEI